jgi:PAS domain S-box-containing protein
MPATKPAVLTAPETPTEAHLRHVIETQPVCLTRIASDGTVLAVNEAALSMIGAERLEQVLGTSFLSLIAPASQDTCRTFLKRIATGGRGSTEVEMTALGGMQYVLQLHAAALATSLDGVESTLCTFRDVTEQRRLETALVSAAAREKQDSDAEWADLTAQLDSAREGAGADEELRQKVADLERQLAEARAREQELVENIAGDRTRLLDDLQKAEQRFEETIGDRLGEVAQIQAALEEARAREQAAADRHAADQAQWKQALADASAEHEKQRSALEHAVAELERTLEGKRAGDGELQQQIADLRASHDREIDELRTTIATLEAALNDANEHAGRLAAAHDAARVEWEQKTGELTARHEAERADWEAQTRQLSSTLDAARAEWEQQTQQLSASFETERAEWERTTGQIAAGHDAALRALEQAAAEHAREQEAAVATERARAEALSHDMQALADESSQKHRELVAERDRLEGLLAGAAAEGAELGARLSECVIERAALEREIQRTGRLAEVGRLAASLAADLDLTLGGLVESSRTLVREPIPDAARPSADAIVRGIVEARALVRQLTRAADRNGAAVEIDAVAAIREIEPSLAGLLGSRIAVAVITAVESATIAIARDDLETALIALVTNRRAAMAAGGQITIEVAAVEIDDECARERGGVLPGPYLLVSIHMSGRGVDAGIRPELVERPISDSGWRNAGAGIGTAARIVTSAGGYVWLTRESSEALAFELYVPSASGNQSSTPTE